jgi:hypothetical protein
MALPLSSNLNSKQSAKQQIACPHCGNKFSPEDSIEHELRARLEQEFERKHYETLKAATERVRAEEENRYQLQMKRIEDDRQAKAKRLKSLEEKILTVAERERDLREREEGIDLEMKKRLLEREAVIRQHVEKSAYEKAGLEFREREQKLTRERELWEMQAKKKMIE